MPGPYGVIVPVRGPRFDPVLSLLDPSGPDGPGDVSFNQPLLPDASPSSQVASPDYGQIPSNPPAGPGSDGSTPYAPIQAPAPAVAPRSTADVATVHAPVPGPPDRGTVVWRRATPTQAPPRAPVPAPASEPPRPPAPGGGGTGLLQVLPNARQGDQKGVGGEPVKYVSDEELRRSKYLVTMQWRLRRRGKLLDTHEIKNHFLYKDKKVPSDLGMALLGKDRSNRRFALPQDWMYDSCIWVCVPVGNDGADFYCHVGKKERFHHSSFMAGGGVICAGEWIVRQGKLLKISANSGHYRPPISALHRAVLFMTAALQVTTTVFLYDTVDDRWVDHPVSAFLANPSNGGRYRTHPEAQAL